VKHRKKLAALAMVLVAPFLAHGAVLWRTAIEPPAIAAGADAKRQEEGGLARVGASYTRHRGGVREVFLQGDAETIGDHHAKLLRERMIANEGELTGEFEGAVPFLGRVLLMDMGRLRYRHVDRGVPEDRRRELAAEARAFAPDPFAKTMPSYQRLLFLHALYDIALSFEDSPLIGCTSFALGPSVTRDGHVLLARAFDFEQADAFDRDKAVFFVDSPGTIPFASVAWPGLVGVLSGMNLEGVALIVNGARARDPRAEGIPVIYALREVLEKAHDTDEALAILRAQKVMVSHIVMVTDARGKSAIVERTAGEEAYVRSDFPDPDRVGVTNHFEGPWKDDPRNLTVRQRTSTVSRRARLDELLASVPPKSAGIEEAVSMLRDHHCAGNASCELGDRRTVDALIATHGIVADTTDRALWVSAGPHLSGRFVRFDLRSIFAKGHDPTKDGEPSFIAEDPIMHDGRYEQGRARAGTLHLRREPTR